MKAKVLGLLACIAIASIAPAGPSHAMTLVGTTSDASGISGLVVDGVTYDVTFYNSSYDSVYSSTVPTFLGNSSGAADAASALASALTSFGVTELVGIGPQYNTLLVPFSDARTGVLACAPCSGYASSYVAWQSTIKISGTWTTDPALAGYNVPSNITGSNDSVTYSYVDYPVFAAAGSGPAVTPLPPTWTMMLIGLAGFGVFGWLRKRQRVRSIRRKDRHVSYCLP
jgi:hypothetical protein